MIGQQVLDMCFNSIDRPQAVHQTGKGLDEREEEVEAVAAPGGCERGWLSCNPLRAQAPMWLSASCTQIARTSGITGQEQPCQVAADKERQQRNEKMPSAFDCKARGTHSTNA